MNLPAALVLIAGLTAVTICAIFAPSALATVAGLAITASSAAPALLKPGSAGSKD